jgi:hypothetical protein
MNNACINYNQKMNHQVYQPIFEDSLCSFYQKMKKEAAK